MSDLTIEQGKKGFLTLKFQGRYLHSAINPLKEAERLLPQNLDSSIYFVLGAGLGYHIQLLLEKIPTTSFVFVFEENPDILKALKEHNPIQDSRLHLFLNKDFSKFMKLFKKIVPFHLIQNPSYLELKSETLLFFTEYQKIRSNIREFLNYYLQSLFTEAEFSPLWYQNILLNSPFIFNPKLSLYLEGGAVLVAAGPSLPKSFNLIKKLQKKAPVFAVDTALKPLIEAGITPDVVVAADSQIHNYKDFFHLSKLEDIILACDISVYHKIPPLFKKTFFFKTEELGDALFETMNKTENISLPSFPGGGSVSSCALMLIRHLGAKKIVLIGQDLCYPHLTHSRGSIHFDRALYSSHKTSPVWNFFNNIKEKRGYQDLFMQNLTRWIGDFINLSNIKVYQIEPQIVIQNALQSIPDVFKGRFYIFDKLKRYPETRKLFFNSFLSILLKLRKASSALEFNKIREQSLYSVILKNLFMRQDLYLNRKGGDEVLFLGGCFKIADRLIKTLKILLKQEK